MNENKYNYVHYNTEYAVFKLQEESEWKCYLFGSSDGGGVTWVPLKGKEPNWFWRKMQYLFFGNKWVKRDS